VALNVGFANSDIFQKFTEVRANKKPLTRVFPAKRALSSGEAGKITRSKTAL